MIYMNCCGYIMWDVFVDWVLGVMNDGDVVVDFDFDLVGEGVYLEVKVVVISVGK